MIGVKDPLLSSNVGYLILPEVIDFDISVKSNCTKALDTPFNVSLK